MTKIYTVKSNAKRDARKLGIDPSAVVAVEGGWEIRKPEEPSTEAARQAPETLPQPAKRPRKVLDAKKRNALRTRLSSGWAAVPDLCNELGWLPHTLRGAISTLTKNEGLKVERIRESGITSYRVVE